MKFTQEMIEQAKELKNVEELISFAKENGEELTTEQAEEYFAKLHKSGELADDELDNVSGGCSDDMPQTQEGLKELYYSCGGGTCNYYVCPHCNIKSMIYRSNTGVGHCDKCQWFWPW